MFLSWNVLSGALAWWWSFAWGGSGWLEGTHLAQLASDEYDAVPVAALRTGRNGFLVVAEEGDFPCTGPWHCNGRADNYFQY
jgi:hypothetical protein